MQERLPPNRLSAGNLTMCSPCGILSAVETLARSERIVVIAPEPPHYPPSSKQLWVKSLQLQQLRRQLTYVDYRQAEADCEVLAAQLLAVYGDEGVRELVFVAIPRGGLIVLGMLSYWLNLSPSQMATDAATVPGPLCVVDDCSLTGLRLQEMLTRTANSHVIFAHLYSPPGLRHGILDREPRVRCCLAARDLAEIAGAHPVAPPGAGGAHLWEPLPLTRAYWSGSAAPIAFAWSEPLIHIRDPFSGRVESGWRFAPPHRCTKNRIDLGAPVRPAVSRRWQAPEDLVVGQFDGVLWLIRTQTGETHSLQALKADAWRGLAAYGDTVMTLDFLASRHPLSRSELASELTNSLQWFEAEGLLVPAHEAVAAA